MMNHTIILYCILVIKNNLILFTLKFSRESEYPVPLAVLDL